jgi:hypothetical protein
VNTLNAETIAEFLIDLIELDDQPWSDDDDRPTVRSFEEAGVMTRNASLVLRTPEGEEYQISVVRSH